MAVIKKYYALLVSVVIFIVYLFTMAPSVIHLDAGELAAVQSTLGIAHPTGYPLFTIIGYLFSHILFSFEKIVALNILAALYCVGSIYFFIKSIEVVLDQPIRNQNEKNNIELSENQKIIVAAVAGLSLAFTETFWMQSTSTEVYSLHILLLSMTIYFVLKAFSIGEKKFWYFTAVSLALGFSNHMTTLLILPGIAYLFFSLNGFNRKSLLLIGKMMGIFFPVLVLLYSYLPLRSSSSPIFDWGNPVNFENFIRHVSGKQYQVWIFSSFKAAEKQLSYFINTLPQELGYIGLAAVVVGLFYLMKRSKATTIFFIINFIAAVFYSINYDIADIDAYFLLAYLSLVFFSTGLLVYLTTKFKSSAQLTLVVLPAIIFAVNFNRVDQSNIYTFEDYTKNILNNAEKNSVVFGYLWDSFISPSYYFQYVENYRQDVAVIDKELLRRSWYYEQMRNNFPQVVDDAEPQIERFLKALEPFERDEKYNARVLEMSFRNMMTSLIETNIDEREFYLTPELVQNELQSGELSLPEGYSVVPMELFLKVVPANTGYVEADPLSVKIRYNDMEDVYQQQVRSLVSTMLLYRLSYELRYQMKAKAERIYTKLKNDYSEIAVPHSILNQLQSL